MRVSEISSLFVESAKQYYDWLDLAGKGVDRITVNEILRVDEKEYQLLLTKKPFSIDMLQLAIDRVTVHEGQYRITRFDEEKWILNIRWNERNHSFEDAFANKRWNRVTLFSDLKFLIQNVKDWYERNGSKIILPRSIAELQEEKVNQWLEGYLYLSEEQKRAVVASLTEPFSYIWGAPGTGKTRFVLAHSILYHIQKNDRVLLLAPTNNSLDQSLRGVIEVLKENGISMDCVFRIGTPTAEFFKDYSECCEDRKLQKYRDKVLEELEENLADQNSIREYEHLSECVAVCESLLDACLKKENLENRKKEITHELESLHNCKREIDNTYLSLQGQIKSIETNRKKVLHQLKRKLSISFAREEEDKERKLKERANKVYENREGVQRNIDLLESNRKKMQKDIDIINLSGIFRSVQCVIRRESITIPLLGEVSMNPKQVEDICIKLRRLEMVCSDCLPADNDMNSLLEEEKSLRHQLESTDSFMNERLDETRVLAMTIDGYIYRFDRLGDDPEQPYKYEADHIYLDEAGYCSLAKGGTILRGDIPTTLLGDHMQLPPICEAKKRDFLPLSSPILLWDWSLLHAEELWSKTWSECIQSYDDATRPLFCLLEKSNLTATFRFGDCVAQVLDRYIYHNGFHSAAKKAFEIEVIDVKRLSCDGRDHYNTAEAERISELVNNEGMTDFAVLTPYVKQRNLICQNIWNGNDRKKVMTIHASQGREWDTVIISIVDTDNKFFVGIHVKDAPALNLLNTAVSRARNKLIIVCDESYWKRQGDELVNGLITCHL